MSWHEHAESLAARVAHRHSRWRESVATTPRHLLVPRWFERSDDGWTLCEGAADPDRWMQAAFRTTRSLVTRVGPRHADHAANDERPIGRPTSSSTNPWLVLQMYRHGHLYEGADVLDVGVGSGYGTALLCRRLGDEHVTSVDVDPYLTEVAAERLAAMGLRPRIETRDATGPLAGDYDQIVAMVSIRPIPASWVAALRPGGRLVAVLTGTSLIVTADKKDDGRLVGRVEWDRAGFMNARSGPDYPPYPAEMFNEIRDQTGDQISQGRYPVVQVLQAWDLDSTLELTAPDINHYFEPSPDGRRTMWMWHADGSWARATAMGGDPPVVHQSGPRRLWDVVEAVRHRANMAGEFPVRGAKVSIDPDGTCHLTRGGWDITVPGAPAPSAAALTPHQG